jgi:hypothetical protein
VKGLSVTLLDGIGAIHRELDTPAFYAGHIVERNEMVMVLVARIVLAACELDAVAFNAIDSADMTAICADNLGMFLDVRYIEHDVLLSTVDNALGSKMDASENRAASFPIQSMPA